MLFLSCWLESDLQKTPGEHNSRPFKSWGTRKSFRWWTVYCSEDGLCIFSHMEDNFVLLLYQMSINGPKKYPASCRSNVLVTPPTTAVLFLVAAEIHAYQSWPSFSLRVSLWCNIQDDHGLQGLPVIPGTPSNPSHVQGVLSQSTDLVHQTCCICNKKNFLKSINFIDILSRNTRICSPLEL